MSIAQKIAERLKNADDIMAQTLKESRQLMAEAKSIHDKAISEINVLVGKKTLTEDEKRKYAELQAARNEAEKAYYMLRDLLKINGSKENA